MNKGMCKIFSAIPDKYELINHILTFGFDIYWRKKSAKLAVREGTLFLDVCTGTGEMALNLTGGKRKVVALDFCFPMLEIARRKDSKIRFVIGDAGMLPFHDETFDVITISFATRNINVNRENLIKCFKEFRRILKRGGNFFNLETTQPFSRIWRCSFHAYVKIFVKKIGSLISGSEIAYKYLAHTIPRFYDAEEFRDILYESGFSNVCYKRFFPKIVALHIAEK